MKALDVFLDIKGESNYKVIVNGLRNHPHSAWFRTRQSARDYKKLIRRDPEFDDVKIIRQITTEEGFIIDDKIIF